MIESLSIKMVGGALAGGLLGYGWYRLVGCPNGTCPLTSNPWISTIYGIVLGILATIP